MYKKKADGHLYYKRTSKGKLYSEGTIEIDGKEHIIECYMVNSKHDGNPNFKLYKKEEKEEKDLKFF